MSNPRFVIVDTIDAPSRNRVAEWVEGVGYCYMQRTVDHYLRRFDGMNPNRPTPLEAFGFTAYVGEHEVIFKRIGSSTATYEDGKPRRWQDEAHAEEFALPLIKDLARKARPA